MSLAEIYINEQLSLRPPKQTDHLKEKHALHALAARMADEPESVLPAFVDLAMELADGSSAGISLYEENPAPGLFRWRYLRGALARFDNATTPRDFSPCGITLDRGAPTLSLHPERFYDWIADANIVVPEVLLVPLHYEAGKPMGTLWIVSDEEGHFDSGHARAMTELAGFVSFALRMLRVEQRLRHALEEQQTLAKEMSHRVKNLFAMTDGMIRLTAKESAAPQDMARMLSGRLQALARAHSLAERGGRASDPAVAQSSDLGELVKTILAPHERADSRYAIGGPDVACGERTMNALALVLHELATNAAKYGALSTDDGRIEVEWTVDAESLTLSWSESGGPAVANAPAADGFGSQLMRMMIVGQLGGTLDYNWRPSGLVVTVAAPLAKLAA